MTDPVSLIRILDSRPEGLPVVVGCPFPAQQITDGVRESTITFTGGRQTAAQVALLTPPTPGGVRWAELSFLAVEGGPAKVTLGPPPKAAHSSCAVESSDGCLRLSNGLLRIRLSSEPTLPPASFERLQPGGTPMPLGRIAPEVVMEKGMLHLEQPGQARRLTVIRQGPLRLQAEVLGTLASLAGSLSLSYRVTVEIWAGLPAARVDFMLSHVRPGVGSFEVHRATLKGEWEVGRQTARRFLQICYSQYYKPREVRNPDPVALVADDSAGVVHVADPAMLRDDTVYPFFLRPPTTHTADWLVLEGGENAIAATMVDMTAMRPNRLESFGPRLDAHFIPEGHATDWPQGRRREQTLLLAFAEEGVEASRLTGPLSDVFAFGRALPASETLAALRCFDLDVALPYVPGRNVRITQVLNDLCRLNTPSDKWNLGDTIDSGYTQSYAGLIPGGLKPRPGAPPMRLWFNTGNCLFPDPVFKGIVQPVWTNNEYDMIHALAVEVARTGKSDYLPMLRWSARHTIEVDFVAHCDERMNHRGTPQHSPNHNTSGVISSHLWTQGLLQYYLLTGDRDALDVAHALGEKVMDLNRWSEARSWGFDREIGWGLLSLVCLVEAGFDRYREECIAMSDFLQNYDRRSYRGPVYLSTGRRNRSLERQMVDGGLGYSPLMEAMDRWQKITRRPDTEAWLKELLLQYQRETWNAIAEGEVPHQRYMVPDVMGIGYERTGDRTFIDLGLAILENYDFVREQPVGEIKPSAMTYRAVFRFLGHADRLGLLDSFESPAIVRLRKRAEER